MKSLTERQMEVLQMVKDFIVASGFPPTRVEIAKSLGFRSANAAEEHLRALARKGAIELLDGTSRGIRVVEEQGLSVIGQVAAGAPILAEQNIEERYRIDPNLFKPCADYLLRVQGMSMRDAGILNGDLLAVHSIPTARKGQVVVARVDDEVTVKRFTRLSKSIVQLLPENPEFEPIDVNLREQNLTIEGIGVGVIRNPRKL